MVLQIGALKSGRDADVEADIAAVVDVAHSARAIVKVIFENAYLTDDEKVRACHMTEAAGGDFVKTSTGFAPSGATHEDLRLMRANTSPHIGVKAAGGVRTLDALLEVMALGVTRVGATATKTMLDDFRARKAGAARRARRRPPASAVRGRLLSARHEVRIGMLGSGFIAEFHALGLRYVPDARVVGATRRAGAERATAFAARFGAGRYDSIDGRLRRPRGRPRRRLAAEPPARRGRPRRGRATARAWRARSRSAATATRPAEMLAPRRRRPASSTPTSRTSSSTPRSVRMREMVEAGAIGRLTTFRAREGHSGPHAPHFWDAELAGGGALLDMASHGAEAARYLFGKDVADPRRVRLGRDPRPRATRRPARTTR